MSSSTIRSSTAPAVCPARTESKGAPVVHQAPHALEPPSFTRHASDRPAFGCLVRIGQSFEESTPRPTSPLAASNLKGKVVVTIWCWVLWAIDAGWAVAYYIIVSGLPKGPQLSEGDVEDATGSVEGLMGYYMGMNGGRIPPFFAAMRYWTMMRAVALALAQAHLAMYSGRLAAGVGKIRFVCGCLLLFLGILAFAAAAFTLNIRLTFDELGAQYTGVLNDLPYVKCLMMVADDEVACATAHLDGSSFEHLVGVADGLAAGGNAVSNIQRAWSCVLDMAVMDTELASGATDFPQTDADMMC